MMVIPINETSLDVENVKNQKIRDKKRKPMPKSEKLKRRLKHRKEHSSIIQDKDESALKCITPVIIKDYDVEKEFPEVWALPDAESPAIELKSSNANNQIEDSDIINLSQDSLATVIWTKKDQQEEDIRPKKKKINSKSPIIKRKLNHREKHSSITQDKNESASKSNSPIIIYDYDLEKEFPEVWALPDAESPAKELKSFPSSNIKNQKIRGNERKPMPKSKKMKRQLDLKDKDSSTLEKNESALNNNSPIIIHDYDVEKEFPEVWALPDADSLAKKIKPSKAINQIEDSDTTNTSENSVETVIWTRKHQAVENIKIPKRKIVPRGPIMKRKLNHKKKIHPSIDESVKKFKIIMTKKIDEDKAALQKYLDKCIEKNKRPNFEEYEKIIHKTEHFEINDEDSIREQHDILLSKYEALLIEHKEALLENQTREERLNTEIMDLNFKVNFLETQLYSQSNVSNEVILTSQENSNDAVPTKYSKSVGVNRYNKIKDWKESIKRRKTKKIRPNTTVHGLNSTETVITGLNQLTPITNEKENIPENQLVKSLDISQAEQRKHKLNREIRVINVEYISTANTQTPVLPASSNANDTNSSLDLFSSEKISENLDVTNSRMECNQQLKVTVVSDSPKEIIEYHHISEESIEFNLVAVICPDNENENILKQIQSNQSHATEEKILEVNNDSEIAETNHSAKEKNLEVNNESEIVEKSLTTKRKTSEDNKESEISEITHIAEKEISEVNNDSEIAETSHSAKEKNSEVNNESEIIEKSHTTEGKTSEVNNETEITEITHSIAEKISEVNNNSEIGETTLDSLQETVIKQEFPANNNSQLETSDCMIISYRNTPAVIELHESDEEDVEGLISNILAKCKPAESVEKDANTPPLSETFFERFCDVTAEDELRIPEPIIVLDSEEKHLTSGKSSRSTISIVPPPRNPSYCIEKCFFNFANINHIRCKVQSKDLPIEITVQVNDINIKINENSLCKLFSIESEDWIKLKSVIRHLKNVDYNLMNNSYNGTCASMILKHYFSTGPNFVEYNIIENTQKNTYALFEPKNLHQIFSHFANDFTDQYKRAAKRKQRKQLFMKD